MTVYYDPSPKYQAAGLAQEILKRAPRTFADCQAFFAIQGQPVNVILAPVRGATDGSGGGYHNGCDFTSGGDLYCDIAIDDPDLTNGIVIAELTECFMGVQGKGWLCNCSNGEALSRFLAGMLTGGADGPMAQFKTGPKWDQHGRPNYIDNTDLSDQNDDSIGCGMVYLYWMLSKGYTAFQITQAGCPDNKLASNYQALTGSANAWTDFSNAVSGLGGSITSDNPWSAARESVVAAISASLSDSTGQSVLIDLEAKTITAPRGWRLVKSSRREV